MRSAILLASAMAIGAIAGPVNKRYIVTKYNLEIKTVTVYVTAAGPQEPLATHNADNNGGDAPAPISTSKKHKTKSKVVPKPTSVYTPPPPPPPPPSSTPEPAPAPKPTPIKEPEPEPKPVPTSKPAAPSKESSGNAHRSGTYQEDLKSGPEYKSAVLFHHNIIRANHDAAPLVWDDGLEDRAKWSAQLCNFTHQFPNKNAAGDGQNIFAVSGPVFNVTAGIEGNWYGGEFKKMTDANLWGKEVPTDAPIFHDVGHLTQIVWKKTTKVACWSEDCSGKMVLGQKSFGLDKFTVCNYAEPGNFKNQFIENVGVPKSYNLPSWSD